jgi:Kef-type K+ transport system membrane component KefB
VNVLLGAGIILLSGFIIARFAYKVKLPSVTTYLVLGIILGPALLNLVPESITRASGVISNFVLAIIAFSIGQNFSLNSFKKIGKSVLWISILAAIGAWLLVTFVLLAIRVPFYLALVFGSLAAATAPAATVMVIREYRSRGPFTDTLLGVVAIDDAWCLIIFAVSLAVARALYVSTSVNQLYVLKVIGKSLLEILGALGLGAAIAYLVNFVSRLVRNQAELLIYTLGFILLAAGLAMQFHLSVLLASMFLAIVLVNTSDTSFEFFESLHSIDSPLYLIFFVIAGASMDVSSLSKIGIIGSVYIVARIIGKMLGAYTGARISHAPANIKKYLGLGLMPQAGVALGCALIAKANFPHVGDIVLTTILATTIVYELIGPSCTRFALKKAGEIHLEK